MADSLTFTVRDHLKGNGTQYDPSHLKAEFSALIAVPGDFQEAGALGAGGEVRQNCPAHSAHPGFCIKRQRVVLVLT